MVSCRDRRPSTCCPDPVDTNPYQSPQTDCYACENRRELSPGVDGKYLVVSASTVLPPICVKTNQPVSQTDMIRGTFYWCSPWVAILVLGGPLVIPAIFLLKKRVSITYGLVPELRREWRVWRIAKISIAIAFATPTLALAGMLVILPLAPLATSVESILTIGVLIIVAFVVSLPALFIGNPPLTVVKHRRGLFWVKGCSAAYLARLEAEGAFGLKAETEPRNEQSP